MTIAQPAWDAEARGKGEGVRYLFFRNTYFLHANHLGSDTQVSDYAGTVQTDFIYYPGGNWTNVGSMVDAHYAGFQQGAGPDYGTPTRRYSGSLSRWFTPDPLGGDVTNPQSLNRYAYALNNPTTLVDPLGLYTFVVNGCIFDMATFYVNGQYSGTETNFYGCFPSDPKLLLYSPGSAGEGGTGGNGGVGGNGGKGTSNNSKQPGATVCTGPAKFTGVTQEQAPDTGSLSAYGILGHQFGGVAVKPSLYGASMPGSRAANTAAQATVASMAPLTAIIPQFTNAPGVGGPTPPYRVTDIIGPASVRNTPGQQFDVYDFPSEQSAKEATMGSVNTFIVVQDPNYACPAGFVKY